MSKLAYIEEEKLDSFSGFVSISTLDRIDVCTLLDAFTVVRSEVDWRSIVDVKKDSDGYFYLIVRDGYVGDFSIFDYISERYEGDIPRLNCINAGLLFPKCESRGILDIDLNALDENVTVEDDEDDIATGYLEDDDDDATTLLDEGDMVNNSYTIHRRDTRDVFEITEGEEITIGRSAKRVDCLIKGNSNVGRLHCKIYVRDGVLKIHDFQSLNGTYVNSRRVRDIDIAILKGDIFTIAGIDFEVM